MAWVNTSEISWGTRAALRRASCSPCGVDGLLLLWVEGGEQQWGYLTVRRKTARSRFSLMPSNSFLSMRRFKKWDPNLPGRDDYL